jgi:hypothetical protein
MTWLRIKKKKGDQWKKCLMCMITWIFFFEHIENLIEGIKSEHITVEQWKRKENECNEVENQT